MGSSGLACGNLIRGFVLLKELGCAVRIIFDLCDVKRASRQGLDNLSPQPIHYTTPNMPTSGRHASL